MATETAIFEVQLRADQARRQLAELRGEVDSSVTAKAKLAGALDRVDVGSKKIAGSMGALRLAMGQASGQAAEMFRSVSDVADLMAAGGPWGAAIAAAGAGLFYLHSQWEANNKAAADFYRTLKQGADQQVMAAVAGLKEMQAALDNFGKSSIEVRRGQIEAERNAIAAQEQERQRAVLFLREREQQQRDRIAQLRAGPSGTGSLEAFAVEKELKATREMLAVQESQLQVARDTLPIKQRELDLANQLLEKESARLNKTAVGGGGAAGRGAGGIAPDEVFDPLLEPPDPSMVIDPLTDILGQRLAARDMFAAEEDRRRDLEHEMWLEAERAFEAERTRIAAEAARERERAFAQSVAQSQQIYAQALGIVAGGTQQLLDGLISGQEHATEMAIASIFKQAGTALIGHGISAVAGGLSAQAQIANLVTGGASGIATGGALIAAGLAMGGVGSGIEAGISGAGRGGGAPLDRGVNSGGSRSGVGGGGREQTVIIHNHGSFGPGPTETARAVQHAIKKANRRRLPL